MDERFGEYMHNRKDTVHSLHHRLTIVRQRSPIISECEKFTPPMILEMTAQFRELTEVRNIKEWIPTQWFEG